MSFLYRSRPALRGLTLARTSRASNPCLFSTTAVQSKTATEAIKDTVKSVDRVVSDAAVSGIEKGGKPSFLPFPATPFAMIRKNKIPCMGKDQIFTPLSTLLYPPFPSPITSASIQ